MAIARIIRWLAVGGASVVVLSLAGCPVPSMTLREIATALLRDDAMAPYGWLLESAIPGAMLIGIAAEPYNGSSGMDIVDTGPEGLIKSSGSFNTGDGPDILRFTECRASDVRSGSSLTGGVHDNDLVIGGDEEIRAVGDAAIRSASIHTGPGSDLVFLRNMEHAAIDLGNGADGRTDTLDEQDGNDMVVLQGNIIDCRVFGGAGDDTFVWYIDDISATRSLYANSFFGAGGWDPAVWDDEGIDRLIVVLPDDTPVSSGSGIPPAGSVRIWTRPGFPDEPVPDSPTVGDVNARYYGTAGLSPEGRKTVYIDYRPPTGDNHAGDNYLTGVEELQVGIGANAKVYRIDDINGAAIAAPDLEARRNIPTREAYHALADDFAGR